MYSTARWKSAGSWLCSDVADAWGIQVDAYTHAGNAPLGYYQYGRKGSQAIMLGVENLSTWAHEMVHAADHRLTNLAGSKTHKEIVAELEKQLTEHWSISGIFSYDRFATDSAQFDTQRYRTGIITTWRR